MRECKPNRFWLFPIFVLVTLVIGSVSGLAWSTDLAAISRENLRPGVTDISQQVYGLHMFVVWVCVAIAVVVYGVLLYSIFAYRKSKGAKAATFSHSTKAEIVWTLIPIVLLVMMAIPTVKVLAKMYDTSETEIDILVTGYQWKWQYEYLDNGISFFSVLTSEETGKNAYTGIQDQIYKDAPKDSTYLLNVDNQLIIPVDTKVRFLITAADVIHSWWVPDFAVKRDAIPGYVNEAWTIVNEEGVYRGQCAELCGKDHAYMPIVVKVVSKETYKNWVAEKRAEIQEESSSDKEWTPEELVAKGEAAYATACVACHQAQGQGNPPIFPALVGSSVVNGDKAKVIDTVLNGVPKTAMQAFGKQFGDADIAAIISYIRSSWGNAPADGAVVQPKEVAAAR